MKYNIKQNRSKTLLIWMVLLSFQLTSCEEFLDVKSPINQIPDYEVFEDKETATAAVTTLYAKLRDNVLLTGNSSGLGVMLGLYADELDFSGMPYNPAYNFYTHQIIASDTGVETIWTSSYNLIYMANSVLYGIENSTAISDELKNQLRGETLFIRALTHFYLVNLYGDIPYISTTDYIENSTVSKQSIAVVYQMIENDLLEAKSLLNILYPTNERIRANTYAVSALLARMYLYRGNWANAILESSLIINSSSLYALEADINKEFLKQSSSAILQLKPKNSGSNTLEASNYIFSSVPPPFVSLSPNFVESLSNNDLRRQHWIGQVTNGTQTWYYPYKYKENLNTGTSKEYSIVLRLSEQYLIRAEARLKLNDIEGACEDLNPIRLRAGLSPLESNSIEVVMDSIIKERKVELFCEQGHRWFDLKRNGIASEILSPIKPTWSEKDVLLPIPEADILKNSNLLPQNVGY